MEGTKKQVRLPITRGEYGNALQIVASRGQKKIVKI